jgi:hypothetical protein
VSIDNQTFAEVGGVGAVGNRFSFNQIFAERPDSAAGFIVHGAGTFGGARRTVLDHNSVRLLGSESVALSCFERCGPKILRVRDNVFSADSPAKSPASFDEDRNLFSAGVGFELGRESLVADPLFASPRGVRLRAASPAARAGFGALSEEPRGER